ncbi:ABC transporter ATP-binding protein/permease [Patescibacteria group bacterium]|nr:ABC transporter ATP-binding protein/permease [Patescibacteria group bacterium]MBU1702880.1 ABC transporter ATP-binding protein/permease [Patescibacteria group bacterium]MBU1953363.1 ABC transporter ATP-binding protein/permease [Patescibacteria group bacterium]
MKFKARRTIRIYWSEVMRFKWWMALMLFLLIMATFASMTWAIVIRQFFDVLSQDIAKDVAVGALIGLLYWLLLVEALEWIGWRGTTLIAGYFQPRIMTNLVNRCFDYLHLHSHAFFSDNFSGALVKKVTRFARSFEDMQDKFIFDMIPLALKILIIVSVLTYLNWILGLIMFSWMIIFLLLTWRMSLIKLKHDLARSAADTKVTASLADTITNSDNVKLFAAHKFESQRFINDTLDWARKMTKSNWMHTYFDGFQAFLMILLELGILYSAIRLWGDGKLVLADFFLIQAYVFETFHQLWNFGRNIRDLYERLADAEEMTVILNTPHQVKDKKGVKALAIKDGRVDFKSVSFGYSKGEESVIHDLSLKVRPGEKVALIGPSGGGKSTIVKLLLRMYDIRKGQILIDGQNIAYVTQESLHNSIALVPQDPILFHRTLMENIRYGRRDALDEEVIAASKMARCHEFIGEFAKGYDTYVGERGVKLSGGQRQRVAIARAILSNAKILVLDEATSSLDSESELLIQEALENLMKQKTTIIVAHRLSTIMSADRIFVLKDGQIIEKGSHGDLVNKSGSLYGKLWNLQVGGYMG